MNALDPAKKILVYADEHIVAYRLDGAQDRLVITFGDLVGCENVDVFFGEPMFRKYGIAAIGLMARRPNWYPPSSVLAARLALLPFLHGYDRVILYGGSMGGYAALRFSRLFSADLVLSLCPQVGAHPDDPGLHDRRLVKHFHAGLRHSRLRADDLHGTIAVLVDHYDAVDLAHAQAVAALSPDVTLYNVPFVGHHVTPILAGGRNFATLVEAATRGDRQAIAALSRRARRDSPHRVDTVLLRALVKRRLSPLRIAILLWKRNRNARSLGFLALYSAVRPVLPLVALFRRRKRVETARTMTA